MAILEELDIARINAAVGDFVEKGLPLAATIHRGSRWINLHSRAVALRDGHLWIEMPQSDNGSQYEFAPGERIGLSFKLKHHKHIFFATVAGMERLSAAEGGEMTVLSVCAPARMQRLQRRAYTRVQVPPNRIVRASFWIGGQHEEPTGTSCRRPVWSGTVTDISAGGFHMRAASDAAANLEVGDIVGVRISFGPGGEALFADAQFRHAEIDAEATGIGFQFIGLGHSPSGREALELLVSRVKEYDHAACGVAAFGAGVDR